MLTRLRIQNFKQFEDVDIELGQTVVFIGPNNSGKTTALQALALWYEGLQAWTDEVSRHITPPYEPLDDRTTLNRLNLITIPIRSTELLWRNLKVVNGTPVEIAVVVEGINEDHVWSHGYQFQFVNEESIYCNQGTNQNALFYIDDAPELVYLPPMSGLIATEDRLERGSINRRIGEGRTAEVLRNLCYQLYERNGSSAGWDKLITTMRESFGIELLPPEYLAARGEIRMAYRERGVLLDIGSAGRGLHQMLLLLAYLYLNPGSVLLLDEPDAHLEIIRQREIYQMLKQVAQQQDSQLIMATHSEEVMNHAFGQEDRVVAFVGKPHPLTEQNRREVEKSLKSIPARDYYLAEQSGWVLYLEGTTDLLILQAFAALLQHDAKPLLERAFFYDLGSNDYAKANNHFRGLREAMNDLSGVLLTDRVSGNVGISTGLKGLMWRKYEIENYFCTPEVLMKYAQEGSSELDADDREQVMREEIAKLEAAYQTIGDVNPWSPDAKASDRVFVPLLRNYHLRLGTYNNMSKGNLYTLVRFMSKDQIDPEVIEKLDAIVEVARRARPRGDGE
ncbi:MAG: AAA family ATPase [bacterium]|nr:AAA family ATPase [bacterium]